MFYRDTKYLFKAFYCYLVWIFSSVILINRFFYRSKAANICSRLRVMVFYATLTFRPSSTVTVRLTGTWTLSSVL